MVSLYGIPKYVQKRVSMFLARSWDDQLWHLFILVVGGIIIYLMAASGGFFVAFIAGTILSIFFADDIRKLLVDIWNRNWAEVKLNLR